MIVVQVLIEFAKKDTDNNIIIIYESWSAIIITVLNFGILYVVTKIYLNNTPVIIFYVESSHDSAAPIK